MEAESDVPTRRDGIGELCKVLRARRRKLSMSQEEFADLCGLDRAYVGGIERGEADFSVWLISRGLPSAEDFSFGSISRRFTPGVQACCIKGCLILRTQVLISHGWKSFDLTVSKELL
jgi:Helix-turn-helix